MPDEPDSPAGAPETPPTEVSFKVDGRLAAVKVAGAVIFLLLALVFSGDPGRTAFAGLGSLVLAFYAARDLIAPRRLSADTEGVTVVVGFAGRRRLGWDQIERVRVDQRRRLGTRSEMLEIDARESLHLFSGYDLGVPVWEAAQRLAQLAPAGLTEVPTTG
ncbi:MAG: hypothetical protein AUI14_11675 [Actinobacteria bacterium 13_2_20CM_2_71_6]|nr:MAG: hypothetical protein AUI14_11675 [Actinobacteria bacterium 13_2_20CM_2_71_6]